MSALALFALAAHRADAALAWLTTEPSWRDRADWPTDSRPNPPAATPAPSVTPRTGGAGTTT